jgi:DNA processing protein
MNFSSAEGKEILAFVRLKKAPGLGDQSIRKLVEVEGSGVAALRALGEQMDLLESSAPDPELSALLEDGVGVVPMTSSRYPARLRDLHDPPSILFMKGDPELLDVPCVAIVGSRKATESGRRSAEVLGRILAESGFNVASGMALGVDGAAHRGALAGGGSTTAVLGSGFRVVYPASHRSLFRQIGKAGLLLTEFLPKERALPHHFPKRNRIIAALADVVVVVEAGRRSGALITVDHALDLGREVFALPGSVENPQAAGTNRLLRDGARILEDPARVLDELQEVNLVPPRASGVRGGRVGGRSGIPAELDPLWEVLSETPLAVDEVANRLHRPFPEVLAGLSALELGGWALRCPGMRFRRS